MDVSGAVTTAAGADERETAQVGQRIRAARTGAGMSMRVLARAVGVSQSALSQIETGRSQPSVQTLYRLVRELDVSFDDLFGLGRRAVDTSTIAGVGGTATDVAHFPADEHRRLELDTGVTWVRLGAVPAVGATFFRISHPPGSHSAPDGKYAVHPGHEFVHVLHGTLCLQIGFDVEHHLRTGDAVSFPATTPHRASNPGPDAAEVLCTVIDSDK